MATPPPPATPTPSRASKQSWQIAEPACLKWLLITYFASGSMAQTQPFKDTIFSIYAFFLPPIFSILLVKARFWCISAESLRHKAAVPQKIRQFCSRLKPALEIKIKKRLKQVSPPCPIVNEQN